MSDEATETKDMHALLARDGRPGTLEERCVCVLIETRLMLDFPRHVVTVAPAEGRIVGGVYDVRLTPRRPTYHCPRCGERPLTSPCEHIDIATSALDLVREQFAPDDRAPIVAVRVVVNAELIRGAWREATDTAAARVSREAARITRGSAAPPTTKKEGNTE